jgi:hypothetical protein
MKRLVWNEKVAQRQKEEIKQAVERAKHEAEINRSIRNAAPKRVRVNLTCDSVAVPPAANGSTPSNEGVAATGLFSEETSRNIQDFSLECDDMVEDFRVAQEFIKDTGSAP